MENTKKKLILASGSPRRREILRMAGYELDIVCPDCEEVISAPTPTELVMENAKRKATAAQNMAEGVILCADTVVCLGNEILGKPKTAERSREMLLSLSGKTHSVITGWVLCDGDRRICGASETTVTMRKISEAEIDGYIKTGSPLDKAGAYGIQDAGGLFVSSINGDYYTVMGLPLCEISVVLSEEFGIMPLEIQ